MKTPRFEAPRFDPGLTQQFQGPLRRIIDSDGGFNVRREGTTWRDVHPYLWLIGIPWPTFLLVLLAAYIAINIVFAAAYYALGPDALIAPAMHSADHGVGRFMTCFFFSAQTLTTVGYGTISPYGMVANLLATFEAAMGLMGLSVGTGVLFGRVSRPSARIGFSEKMLVAPYQDGSSFQFRIVNKRRNSLMNLEATVLLMTVERNEGDNRRQYAPLKLERSKVLFFPLTWTVVHPLEETSPLRNLNAADLERLQVEFLVVVKGFDETFGQTVHARHSYRYDEIVWGAKFRPAFHVDAGGDLVLEVKEVGAIQESTG